MSAVRRPALRYFGAKWRLAPWIIKHLPPHVCYVEPYGGAAGVLLRKEPSELEVYNDLDGEVVNFFRVLREQPEDLERAIQLTPMSREELEIAQMPCQAEDRLERGRRLYVRAWQNRGGPRTQWKGGWRFQRGLNRGKSLVSEWSDTEHLYSVAERLKGVQIECDDALSVIARYDSPATIFMCDPPYVGEVRSSRWRAKSYAHEMTEDAHAELARALSSIRGMAVVCGYTSPLYEDLFPKDEGWRVVERRTLTDAGAEASEQLWISKKAAEATDGRLF